MDGLSDMNQSFNSSYIGDNFRVHTFQIFVIDQQLPILDLSSGRRDAISGNNSDLRILESSDPEIAIYSLAPIFS